MIAAESPVTPLLAVKNLHVHYRAVHAVKGVTLTIPQGKIVTLLGANGAGKSSILRAISGLVPSSEGEIAYDGERINQLPVHTIVAAGISHAPEGRGIFLNLTVEENLDLGSYSCTRGGSLPSGTPPSPRGGGKPPAGDLGHVFDLFPRLKERRRQNAGTLSGGEQQMLAIGRALMAQPRLLLLDEPSLGLAPLIIEKIFEIIVDINREGKTILLVEQNARQALQVAHLGVVLETGQVVAEGEAKTLLHSPEVRKAYLGED